MLIFGEGIRRRRNPRTPTLRSRLQNANAVEDEPVAGGGRQVQR